MGALRARFCGFEDLSRTSQSCANRGVAFPLHATIAGLVFVGIRPTRKLVRTTPTPGQVGHAMAGATGVRHEGAAYFPGGPAAAQRAAATR